MLGCSQALGAGGVRDIILLPATSEHGGTGNARDQCDGEDAGTEPRGPERIRFCSPRAEAFSASGGIALATEANRADQRENSRRGRIPTTKPEREGEKKTGRKPAPLW